MDKEPKNQKQYYHNKVREFEKRTGINMNVKNVSKFYDINIEHVEYNTPAAMDMMQKHGCYIYHDLLVEEDPRSNGTNWLKFGYAQINSKTYKYYYETKQWGQEILKIDLEHYKNKTWKAAKLDMYNSPYLDPGEDYLPYAIEPVSINSFRNKHIGSNFDDFLMDEGIYEEVQARALKRVLVEQLSDAMQSGNLSKVVMAQRMVTSRSQLDRVLDPDNLSIQLDTLFKAARAVGKTVEIRLK
jgi:hypothetical protein